MSDAPPPVGKRVPTPGRMVTYHQTEDARDWPAMILSVDDERSDDGGYICDLQVFRQRGNHWPTTAEGSHDGGWSWPTMTGPSNHELSAGGLSSDG